MGLPNPRELSSLQLLKGVSRNQQVWQQSGSQSSRVRLPITIWVLDGLREVWEGALNSHKITL